MAEGKKSFIAYSDWKGTFDALSDEKAGELIKHIFAYVNDENPISDDMLINAVFSNIQNALKRDLQKWDKQYKQRVKAGLRSAEVRKQNATVVNARSISSTVSGSVSVNVNNNTTKEVEVDFLIIDSWIKEISKSQMYLEGLYRLHKLRKGSISELTANFKEHLKVYPKKHNNFSDFKKHFASWLQIKNTKGELSKHQKETKGQL